MKRCSAEEENVLSSYTDEDFDLSLEPNAKHSEFRHTPFYKESTPDHDEMGKLLHR